MFMVLQNNVDLLFFLQTIYLPIYSTPQHKKEVLHKRFYSLLLHLSAIQIGKKSPILNLTDFGRASGMCLVLPVLCIGGIYCLNGWLAVWDILAAYFRQHMSRYTESSCRPRIESLWSYSSQLGSITLRQSFCSLSSLILSLFERKGNQLGAA